MGKDLIISSNRHETKVAILEDEQLVELYFQRADEYSLVGSIHKGRVTRVLPGMQSAFVNIGLDRDAFLYVTDFFEDSEEYETLPGGEENPSRSGQAEKPEAKSSETPESRDQDRKGRRSRRRRSKGRGFPDSKYAAGATEEGSRDRQERAPKQEAEPLPEIKPEPEPELKSAPEPEPADEFQLLPGETLAKYKDAVQPTEKEESSEPEAEQPEVEEPVALADTEADVERAEEIVEEPAPEPEAAKEDEDEESEVEKSEVEKSEVEKEETDVVKDSDDEPLSEDHEIKEMILGRLDDSLKEELAAESAAEDAADLESSKTSETEEVSDKTEADADQPSKASASVREQDGRYLQRSSRRGRRRGRGGNRSDTRSPKNEQNEASESEPTGKSSRGGRSERNGKADRDEKRPRSSERGEKAPLPSIADLLKEGQEILVQIAKEPLGQKGARITSHIALPGRYVVYMPTLTHFGVSRRIGSDEERMRLRSILQTNHEGIPGGFIMRTAGEGQTEKDIAADMRYLANLWNEIRETADKKPAPALLHHDLQVIERILRDQITDDFSTIWVDNEEAYEAILKFLQRFKPALVKRARLYTRPAPVFDAFNITQELEKALRPKVWLKSGGYIVINQTEALVAIDINTGKYVGKSHRLEDTIVRTNTEAVKEIARQMRLRDLGGIIVVDFIDMDERRNRQKVMQALEEAMRSDRAPNKILQFNDFGLVAITRKRVKQSLERTLCMPCPYCEGGAYVKSVDTVIGEILIEAQKLAPALEDEDVMLRVHPDVAKVLKTSSNEYLQELEETLGCPVLITADPLLHIEKYDLA